MPYLNAVKSKADMQTRFLGYYRHPAADGGQFVDMRNLSSDRFPVLSPRKQRRLERVLEDGSALTGGAELCWVAGGKLYVRGEAVADVSSESPQIVRMGAYVIVWPDKIIYNTHTGELSAMDATLTVSGISVRPCTLTGADYEYTASDSEPGSPTEQQYWWNTQTNALYQYLGGEWQGIDTVYSRIDAPGMNGMFKAYDVVSLSGFSFDAMNMEAATVYAATDEYIIIATGTLLDYVETAEATISRTAPELDYICEAGNRLWGCSSATHEIRGTKLGDPTNWNCYLGISTDSYAATVGSAGDFTGIIQYMGYVHFFKEGCVHRLYGTRPENFQLVELPVRGVKAGCSRSLCTVNQILYYVSREGVMAFDGSSPVNVGDALGDVTFTDCVCGAHQQKLYLSAIVKGNALDGVDMVPPEWPGSRTGEEKTILYVMDTEKGLWHIEDETRAIAFAEAPTGDYYLTDGGEIWQIDGGEEDMISWYGVSGDIGMDTAGHKWIRKITLRAAMERGARLNIDIMYDSSGTWERALTVETERKKTMALPIRTRRCDHFCLRYVGTGDVIIYSLAKTYDMGSERGNFEYRR